MRALLAGRGQGPFSFPVAEMNRGREPSGEDMRKVTDRGNSKCKGSGVRMGLMCIFPSSYGDSIDLYLLVFGVEELGGSRVPSLIRILIQQLFSVHFVPGTILCADG